MYHGIAFLGSPQNTRASLLPSFCAACAAVGSTGTNAAAKWVAANDGLLRTTEEAGTRHSQGRPRPRAAEPTDGFRCRQVRQVVPHECADEVRRQVSRVARSHSVHGRG